MSCERCGSPAQGRLCADCDQMDRVETAHEHRSDGGSVAVEESAEPERRQLEYIPLSELSRHDDARDIRTETVEEIQDRIDADEYNPAKPLRVFETPDGYIVADGNHRLEALRELDYGGSVPCVVEPEYDPEYAEIVEVAAKSNRDEDTFAEDDLFDHLDRIERLSDEHTQAEIAETLGDGWSRSKISDYSALNTNIVAEVLELAKQHQEGRATDNVATATFTEYWFRTSGLYDLNRDGIDEYALPDEDEPKHAQLRVMEWFVHKKNCGNGRGGGQIAEKAEKVRTRCEQLELLEEQLNPGVDDAERERIKNGIVEGSYGRDSLESAIENANAQAKDTAAFGVDALNGLQDLEANSIDCVVTDPPYGVDFESFEDSGTHEYGIDADEYSDLMEATFAELSRVCKANAHLYIFFAAKRFDEITSLAEEYFDVTYTPLMWVKNNGSPTRDKGGYEKRYAHYYEPILVCRMPNGDERTIAPEGEQRKNVLEYDRPAGKGRYHDSQKPRELLKHLITNSTGPSETILDPFAGSGSTLLAAYESGRHFKGFEISEEPEPEFKKRLREVKHD